MNTKMFVWLLAAVLALGGSIGGAFVGGIALGKNQEAEAAQVGSPALSPGGDSSGPSGGSVADTLSQLQQRFRSGDLDQEDLAGLRQQFQGEFERGFGGGIGDLDLSARSGLTATVEAIEGDTLTIDTARGPVQASIGADTAIQMFSEGTLADLTPGTTVTVTGETGEDGSLEAVRVFIVPEDGGGFAGGGGFLGGRRQRGDQDPP